MFDFADYPKIEVVAKSIAEEFGDDFVWNEITLRNANKEDKERIKAALDSDNVTPNSGDWTVKLGANLFYSVHLSWSSLYSKQMPYNPIIQKAFGRRTRRDDEDDEDYGKRSRKKIVEGKWCGKVWMSNQIHPILAHKYNNEENEAHEEDERNYLHSSDEKPAKGKSVNTSTVTKRKKKAAAKSNRSLKERRTSLYKEEDEEVVSDEDVVKSIENNTDSDDNSLEENYRRQQPRGRIYGGSNSKAAEFTPVEDVMNSDVSQSGDSEPPRGEFSDEESAPPPKIYSRRKKQSLIDDVPVISNENCRRPWSLRNKKLKQDLTSSDNSNREMMSPTLNPGLANGRISLPVRQRTPRIASKNVAALCLERQVGGFVEEEEEECQGPSTRLRMKKPARPAKGSGREKQQPVSLKKKATVSSKKKKVASTGSSKLRADEGGEHGCDIEGCGMSFRLKHELTLHMKNICPVKGCGKKFFSHKYLVQHRRVHDDDRPLKCPWKGCKMTFKWAWARTEHIRVHTGVRPYVCGEPGCGQTFRFVSDFSRHKRKTGHSIKGKG